MRNPERIDDFCKKLAEYWHRVPDWRFGQLIINTVGSNPFLFYIEDEDTLKKMDIFFNRENNNE